MAYAYNHRVTAPKSTAEEHSALVISLSKPTKQRGFSDFAHDKCTFAPVYAYTVTM
jgi:hypothetical protein